MKQSLAFLLILFGILLLTSDAQDMDLFLLSKIIGAVALLAGGLLIPSKWWR